ncbi:MAG: alpha/beta fold hydrolase [Planctomycetes bacterium]|nr:alpha/beta fold hydrolase [Planctomycetota bacterium]
MKRKKKIALSALLASVLLILTGVIYEGQARRILYREIAETPRNPDTGVIIGTEAITLPGRSDRACLLIHGWMGSRIDFNDLGERLAQRGFTVRLMRLPGHGTTPLDLESRGLQDLDDAVREELSVLRTTYSEVMVVGFSMGGALASMLAAQEPVDRLVLAAPFFGVTYRPWYLLPPETWNRFIRLFLSYTIKGKAFVQVNREEAKSRLFSYRVAPTAAVTLLCETGRKARQTALLERIDCPVLWLHGREDLAASLDAAEEAFAKISSKDKRRIVLERSNHHLFWDYDAERVMTAILDFLSPGLNAPGPVKAAPGYEE